MFYSTLRRKGNLSSSFQLTMGLISRLSPSSGLYRPIVLLFSTYSWKRQKSMINRLFHFSFLFIFISTGFLLLGQCSASPQKNKTKNCFVILRPPGGSHSYNAAHRASHHQGLVHVVLVPWAAVVVLAVDGKAEEEDVHHVLKDRQEAVRHQERKGAHDEERQHPHRVVPLVVQGQHAAERRAGDDEHLRAKTAELEVKLGPAGREVLVFGVGCLVPSPGKGQSLPLC